MVGHIDSGHSKVHQSQEKKLKKKRKEKQATDHQYKTRRFSQTLAPSQPPAFANFHHPKETNNPTLTSNVDHHRTPMHTVPPRRFHSAHHLSSSVSSSRWTGCLFWSFWTLWWPQWRVPILRQRSQHSNHHTGQHPRQHRYRPTSEPSTYDFHPLRRAVLSSCPCGLGVPVPCPDSHIVVQEAQP
jgi:hypothetical protein